MKVICAWCVSEGRPGSLGDKRPLEDEAETHGLCAEHQAALLAEAGGDAGEPRSPLIPAEEFSFDEDGSIQ